MTADNDNGDDQPATAAAESDATTVVPPPTEAAPVCPETTIIPDGLETAGGTLAWSQDDGQEDPGPSWRSAAPRLAVPLFIAAAAAFAAATMGWVGRHAPKTSCRGVHPVNASDELPKVTGTPDAAAINSGPSTFVMPTATAEQVVQPAPPEPELWPTSAT
jgi:hypothetical protein